MRPFMVDGLTSVTATVLSWTTPGTTAGTTTGADEG